MSELSGYSIMIVVTNDMFEMTYEEFADDYYDYNGYGEDGVLLLVAVESRDWAISTTGYGIKAVTDYGLEYMAKRITPFLSNGSYETAFTNFAAICDRFIGQAKDGKPYDVPKEKRNEKRNDFLYYVFNIH